MNNRNNNDRAAGNRIRNSTMKRIVLVVIALVLPINIMTLILSNMALTENRRQAGQEEQNRIELVGDSISDSLTRSMRRLLYMSLNDTDFITMAKSNRELSAGETGALIYSIRESVKKLRDDYKLVDYMYVYFPGQGYLIGDGSSGGNSNSIQTMIRTRSQANGGQAWEFLTVEGKKLLWGRNDWNGVNFGVILNLDRTVRYSGLLSENKRAVGFFSNEAGTSFTTGGGEYLERVGMTPEELQLSDEYELYRYKPGEYDLVVVEVVERDRLFSSLPKTILIMQALSVLLTMLVIPLLIFFINRRVNRPLNRLVRAMDRIEQGELDYRIETDSEKNRDGREFEQLNRNFNEMMEQLQTLKIDVYEKELERKDIKMRYLSQQILPHFILNAMNILYSYEPEEYQLSRRMILCITKYFRYIVKANATFVTVEQELDHIKNYFEIQHVRFPELFHSEVECGEKVKYALIPPLIVQNFAENAIKHALKAGKEIKISIIAREDCSDGRELLRITLENDGVGISDEILESIERFKTTGEHQEGLGVGIENSIERLRYLYEKEENDISFRRCDSGDGTHVELVMPLYYAEEGVEYGENYAG